MLSREMCITDEITTYNSSIMHVHMWVGHVYLLAKERTMWWVLLKFDITIVPFSTSSSSS